MKIIPQILINDVKNIDVQKAHALEYYVRLAKRNCHIFLDEYYKNYTSISEDRKYFLLAEASDVFSYLEAIADLIDKIRNHTFETWEHTSKLFKLQPIFKPLENGKFYKSSYINTENLDTNVFKDILIKEKIVKMFENLEWENLCNIITTIYNLLDKELREANIKDNCWKRTTNRFNLCWDMWF